MEDYLDLIAKGEKEYYELCQQCLNEIEQVNKNLCRDSKEDILIDANHTYMIGKHGPVIKCKNEDNTFSFNSVKNNIDVNKLRNGEYTLEEIVEDNNLNKNLGIYKDDELFLKKGKFGLYVTWGENKKSIDNIGINQNDITMADVIPIIENTNNPNLLREITKEISIRNGKYGDYIFYKTKKMSKPKFLKLNGFKHDYKNCDLSLIKEWIKETWKIE
jgi:DNA topoisomerase-1